MTSFLAQVPEEVVPEGLTAQDWLFAGVIFVVGLMVAALASVIVPRVSRRAGMGELAARLTGRVVAYVIGIAGLVYALVALDVRIGPLLGALGIGGLALALASQGILKNLIAGILLEIRRPFRRGDEIVSNGFEGVVEDVNLRTVILRSYDGERVYLPSAEVLDAPIENRTAHRTIRTTLSVGVAYGTDLRRAQSAIIEAVGSVEGVEADPAPTALVEAFGESSIDFAVRYWHASRMRETLDVQHAVAVAIADAFRRAGIEIPFPQRTVWMQREPARDEGR